MCSLPNFEQGSCLVLGMDSEDHSSFTTKIKIHGGPVIARFDCITLLDKGSHQSFITRNAWEHMVRSGAATTICETQTPQRCWSGFGKKLSPLSV